MPPPLVLAVVPARNEAETIGDTVRALRAIEAIDEVVVVDDGSTDATAAEAQSAGARLVRSGAPLGKGSAMELGIGVAAADIVVFADGDLGVSAAGIDSVLGPVLAGQADLAIGVLPPQGGGFGMIKRASRWVIRRAGGPDVQEPLSGQRAVTAAALASVRPLASGFGVEVAMTIDAARRGMRIVEVPTTLRHRPPGRTLAGLLHRGRQGSDIARAALPRLLGRRGG